MLAAAPARVLSTGSPDLDVLLEGGFVAGEVYLIESRAPEIARHVVAWLWAQRVCSGGNVCGLVLTERGTGFGRVLVEHAKAIRSADAGTFRQMTAGHPLANVRDGWDAAPRDMVHAASIDEMALIVADGVPTYRGDRTYDETRDVSLRGLTTLARRFDVPVVAFDQDPPATPDHIRAHSLQAIPGSGRVTIRRRGRTGVGIPLPLPTTIAQQLAPRRAPDFKSGGDLMPEVLREPA